jgi:hypothetical protein
MTELVAGDQGAKRRVLTFAVSESTRGAGTLAQAKLAVHRLNLG